MKTAGGIYSCGTGEKYQQMTLYCMGNTRDAAVDKNISMLSKKKKFEKLKIEGCAFSVHAFAL